MRQISISVDLYAKIWSLRQEGEETENDILTRLLSSNLDKQEKYRGSESQDGFRDNRHGVHFPEGFEIFRRFKGKEVRAVASGGSWVLRRDGSTHGSLNELSRAIGAGTENAWMGWHFLNAGKRQPVSSLRKPEAVVRRPKASGEPSEEALWLDDVREGLAAIEGRGLLSQLYKAVENVRRTAGRVWPPTAEAIIQRTLEENSSDSDSYQGRSDLFCMPYGKGAGFWALR